MVKSSGVGTAGNGGPAVYIQKGDVVIEILTESLDESTFNQILTTFKFVDQATKVAADSQTPVAGACAGPTTDQIIIVKIGLDNVPEPRCTKVTADQKLEYVNNSQKTITQTIGNYTLNVAPGKTQTIDAVFGSYLEPGVHRIGTAEIWLQ